jgi:large subunit ribosomal protein L22
MVKNKKTGEVVSYLEDVIAEKKAIPFRRFNHKVAHKKGLTRWMPVATQERLQKLISG